MKYVRRALEADILKDLSKKMVFVGGPRQAGKTALAKSLLRRFPYKKSQSGLYLNWDFDEDRRDIVRRRWDDDHQLVVFDELHKYPRWKNWIKGIYDTAEGGRRFLVTGSARLDVCRRGLRLDLRYIRDKESREVDFVLLREGEVFGLIEVKFSGRKISRSLQYYAEKLRPKHVLQITAHSKRERRIGKGRVVGIQKALRILFDNI